MGERAWRCSAAHFDETFVGGLKERGGRWSWFLFRFFCCFFLAGTTQGEARFTRQALFERLAEPEGGVVAFWYQLKVPPHPHPTAAGDHEEAIIRSHRWVGCWDGKTHPPSSSSAHPESCRSLQGSNQSLLALEKLPSPPPPPPLLSCVIPALDSSYFCCFCLRLPSVWTVESRRWNYQNGRWVWPDLFSGAGWWLIHTQESHFSVSL